MNIWDLDINLYHYDGGVIHQDNIFHKKTLPHLSIVQAIEGKYFIKIGGSQSYCTGEGGVFIAPANKVQEITHSLNPDSKVMKMHWVFLNVLVNHQHRIEDLFDFPVLMPAEHNSALYDLLLAIGTSRHLCDTYSAIYQLLKILLSVAGQKSKINNFASQLSDYINSNYPKSISIAELVQLTELSPASFFRTFKKHFNCSPMEYINQIRLANAALLLETTNLKIKQISEAVGFSDQFYFSNVFRKMNGLAPSLYRDVVKNKKQMPLK